MPNILAYHEFLLSRREDLRRIANAAKPRIKLEEIESAVWITVAEFEERTGSPFDLSTHQENLLGRLYNKLVKFSEKTLTSATSIDQDHDDNSAAGNIVRHFHQIFSATDSLLELESEEENDQKTLSIALEASYSEAIAYAILLERFMGDLDMLADYLRIVVSTLLARIKRAIEFFRIQPTLFDGIDTIDPKFGARLGKRYYREKIIVKVDQHVFWNSVP